mmetsp:Transcript_7361/g.13106  ORF Transcript_7361/g.13106 Transcript_7361/m.13106 type:complete len:117 (+) Transcript_7361:326-676(+)
MVSSSNSDAGDGGSSAQGPGLRDPLQRPYPLQRPSGACRSLLLPEQTKVLGVWQLIIIIISIMSIVDDDGDSFIHGPREILKALREVRSSISSAAGSSLALNERVLRHGLRWPCHR